MPSSPADPASAQTRRRLRILGLGVTAVALLAIAGLIAAQSRPSQTRETPTDVSVAGIAAVGDPAPAFSVADLGGSGEATYVPGRPTVLTFWASWCAPCRKEFPLLRRAAQADPELQVIGVVYKDIPADARAFADETDANWPNAIDESGDLAQAYGVRAIPQMFFIDRAGVIQGRRFGLTTQAELAAELDRIR